MQRMIIFFGFLFLVTGVFGETSANYVCISKVESSNTTFRCTFSANLRFSEWCSSLEKKSDSINKYSPSNRSCDELGFHGKAQKLVYGDVYSCTKLGDKYTQKCSSLVIQNFDTIFK